MTATGSHTPYRRTRTLCVALGVAVPAALAAPAAAMAGSTGGTGYVGTPAITAFSCAAGCDATAASSGGVKLRPGATLRIKGRNLGATRAVIFLGRSGDADDSGAHPAAVAGNAVRVVVPADARSGRVKLIDRYGRRSKPSSKKITITPPPPPPASTLQSGSGKYVWPVDGPVTSPFGPRWGRQHQGIDIGKPVGSGIRAAAAGTVIMAQSVSGYGNFTCIAHAHTSQSSCYAHQSDFLVSKGDSVQQGQVIGRVGMTGNTTGPHLHFEIRNGTRPWATPVDPLPYLPERSGTKAGTASSDGPLDYGLPYLGPDGDDAH